MPCHRHCQHRSAGRGQPDPGLYRCKMGSNTGPNGMGWGRLRQPKGPEAPRVPYSIWQQRMWGCRQGIILRGSLRERKEEGKRGRREKRRGLCPETALRHRGWELHEQEGAGGLGVEVLRVSLEEVSSAGRLHEGRGAPKGWRWAAPYGSRCSRSSPTSPPQQGPSKGRWPWAGGQPPLCWKTHLLSMHPRKSHVWWYPDAG